MAYLERNEIYDLYPQIIQQYATVDQEKEIRTKIEQFERDLLQHEYAMKCQYVAHEHQTQMDMNKQGIPLYIQKKEISTMREQFELSLKQNREKMKNDFLATQTAQSAPPTPLRSESTDKQQNIFSSTQPY